MSKQKAENTPETGPAPIKEPVVELNAQSMGVILSVYDIAIRAPNSPIDELTISKLALKQLCDKAFLKK